MLYLHSFYLKKNPMAKKRKRSKKKKVIQEDYYALSPETKKGLFIIFLIAFITITILSFLELAGAFGIIISEALSTIFGISKIVFPIILLISLYYLIRPESPRPRVLTTTGLILFFLSVNGLFHIRFASEESLEMALNGFGGGLIGYVVSYPLLTFLGFWATLIILISITAASVLLVLNASQFNIFEKMTFLKPRKDKEEVEHDSDEDEDEDEVEDDEEIKADEADEDTVVEEVKLKRKGLFASKDDTKENQSTTEKMASSKFKEIKIDLPVNLLSKKTGKPKSGDIDIAMERIETTLSNFGIDVEMDDVSIGPTVTQYTLRPSDGVKVSRITSLSNDLALALAAHPIRIEAPIPGKSLIGIEVPNSQPATVGLREIIDSREFKEGKSNLGLALGKDVAGKAWVANLAKMPHLLVAGATGSGKSVCLNSIIISLLYQNNPDMLRMILIDPKRVEFPVYNGIPHLLTPVITDVTKAVNALRWAIQEMDQRFDILAKAGKRNIASYNEKAQDKMPYIVIVIDELADLMISASNEVEAAIIRLTQMARAVGIHLILATQRPSVDVITGLIKANVPARIAFSVASSMDSRTILDSVGAEKLIGKGDMLFQTAEISKPRRLQGAFIDDNEIRRVTKFLKQAAGDPEYDETVTEKQGGKTSFDFGNSDSDKGDELFDEAKDLVIKAGKASASYLQRRLRIGYARAARLIDLLEDAGIVGPADGARPREILISIEESEEPTPTIFKQKPKETNPIQEIPEDKEDKLDESNDATDYEEEEENDNK